MENAVSHYEEVLFNLNNDSVSSWVNIVADLPHHSMHKDSHVDGDDTGSLLAVMTTVPRNLLREQETIVWSGDLMVQDNMSGMPLLAIKGT